MLDLVLSDFAPGVRCKIIPGIHEHDHDAVLTAVDISVAASEPVKLRKRPSVRALQLIYSCRPGQKLPQCRSRRHRPCGGSETPATKHTSGSIRNRDSQFVCETQIACPRMHSRLRNMIQVAFSGRAPRHFIKLASDVTPYNSKLCAPHFFCKVARFYGTAIIVATHAVQSCHAKCGTASTKHGRDSIRSRAGISSGPVA